MMRKPTGVKQAEIEERILGLIMGIGIGAIIGFLLHALEQRGDAGRTAPHTD
jgi:hypothetical protein